LFNLLQSCLELKLILNFCRSPRRQNELLPDFAGLIEGSGQPQPAK